MRAKIKLAAFLTLVSLFLSCYKESLPLAIIQVVCYIIIVALIVISYHEGRN